MPWLADLLNSADAHARATAVPCPVCWAPQRRKCYRWNGKLNGGKGAFDTGSTRPTPHPERRQRLRRRTGLS